MLFDFWLKIFGVAFTLGVVSGIVMAFQIGTNWSAWSRMTGPIQGPLLMYESFTAFALEAGFFGVLLFGRAKVRPWFYLFSTAMVALGTTFSAFWIMVNAFPLVFATVLSALYLPALIMLAGLILRGVAFVYLEKSQRTRCLWVTAFAGGSLAAAFMQGVMVGALVAGLPISHGQYVGGDLDWLSPFAILCGLGLCVGYALLGVCWLVNKCEGQTRDSAYLLDHRCRSRRAPLEPRLHVLGSGPRRVPADARLHGDQLLRLSRQVRPTAHENLPSL